MRPTILLCLAASLLPGCASTPVPSTQPADWRTIATDDDRERLRNWRQTFARALARARAAGHGAEIDAEGLLLQPDAALGGPIPDGDYRCRVIKVGAKSTGLLDYIAYPAFACRIRHDGGVQRFAKLTGSQRPVGRIFPADAIRQVFLGTLVLGDENTTRRYGRDADRDVVAWVERIGDNRWRMVLPGPRFESLTDVIELTPAR